MKGCYFRWGLSYIFFVLHITLYPVSIRILAQLKLLHNNLNFRPPKRQSSLCWCMQSSLFKLKVLKHRTVNVHHCGQSKQRTGRWAVRWKMKVPQAWIHRLSNPGPSSPKSSVLPINQPSAQRFKLLKNIVTTWTAMILPWPKEIGCERYTDVRDPWGT